jgi:hypothetical protein
LFGNIINYDLQKDMEQYGKWHFGTPSRPIFLSHRNLNNSYSVELDIAQQPNNFEI